MESFEENWAPSVESTAESYNISIEQNELKLAKKETSKVNFDDGVVFQM